VAQRKAQRERTVWPPEVADWWAQLVGSAEFTRINTELTFLEKKVEENPDVLEAEAFSGQDGCQCQAVERFAKYFRKPPDQLNQDHLREYQAYLLRERKLEPRTAKLHVSALRFFFLKTLKRACLLDDIPYPKSRVVCRRS
jgi:hypothetical protein